MRPRGPDSGATWLSPDGRVGLGSRRLAIIDPTPDGAQPMFSTDGDLAIVFNGEIYNYRELRASIERHGTWFHSQTDTEVLLHLYRSEGEAMLGLLRGMYAFVIWDARERRLFVARDPYGIKPLYVADDGGTVRLASSVRALIGGGGVSEASDPAGVAGFFLTGSLPEPVTIRKAVRAVEAGTSFHVGEGTGPSKAVRHHSVANTLRQASELLRDAPVAPRDVLLRDRVQESVACHLVGDVPIGVFLSAGVDSSTLAAMASRIARDPLHTFTLAFEEFRGAAADESVDAERFARELGTVHTTRTVSGAEFRADLASIIDAMDQPTIDGVNTWFVSKAVHEAGLKVALSGLGGDELFGSYSSFRNVPQLVSIGRVPVLSWAARVAYRHPKAALIGRFSSTYAGAYLLQRGLFLPSELPAIMGEDAAREGLEQLRILELIQAAITPDPATEYGRVATLEACLYMRNQLLRDADWASMAHSVEVRTPLVDAVLLRQVAAVLLQGGSACKEALAAGLPRWLRRRRKTGFSVPMREWQDLPPDGTSTRMRSWARRVFELYAASSR
jgi:asparagine synthase (glutamine-hydrolysing)